MKAKILTSAAAVHFLIDLTCIWLLRHLLAGAPGRWVLAYLLYNFCAFALQLPIGMALDALTENKKAEEASAICLYTSALGCMLLAVTAMTGGRSVWMVLGAGFANAFFHIGCGADLLRLYDGVRIGGGTSLDGVSLVGASSEGVASVGDGRGTGRIGRHGAQGIFVPAGGFGLFAGALLPFSASLRVLLSILLTLSAVLLVFLATRPLCEDGIDEIIGSRETPVLSVRELVTTSLCLFAAAMLHSGTELSFLFTWKTGLAMGLTVALLTVAGKAAGGMLADRFGIRRVLPLSLALASVCLLFSGGAGAGVFALFVYHMSMPLFFSGIYDLFPGKPAFAYGLVKAAIFTGFVPVYAGLQGVLARPVLYGGITFVSLVFAGVYCWRRYG